LVACASKRETQSETHTIRQFQHTSVAAETMYQKKLEKVEVEIYLNALESMEQYIMLKLLISYSKFLMLCGML